MAWTNALKNAPGFDRVGDLFSEVPEISIPLLIISLIVGFRLGVKNDHHWYSNLLYTLPLVIFFGLLILIRISSTTNGYFLSWTLVVVAAIAVFIPEIIKSLNSVASPLSELDEKLKKVPNETLVKKINNHGTNLAQQKPIEDPNGKNTLTIANDSPNKNTTVMPIDQNVVAQNNQPTPSPPEQKSVEAKINELKNDLGKGAFDRWSQLTSNMLKSKNITDNPSKKEVLDELISYGLREDQAKLMIELHTK